jgi:5'-nucleotidase
MNYHRLLVSTCALALASGAGVASADTLTILHTNDFHSKVEPISKYDSPCSVEDNAAGECFGGYARLVTAIESARAKAGQDSNAGVLLVDGGDQFQGSLFYTYYKGKVAAEMMNTLGYDAMTVGNHEFDDGPVVLRAFADTVNFPVLMSNGDVANEPQLAGKILKSTVIEKGGERYGLIGLTPENTGELASPGRNVTFSDPVSAVQGEVDKLQADGVNRIIVLSHSGYRVDQRVAAETSGVDVIVGGHSNTLLSNTDEDAAGPYPTMVGDTAIVQAYAYGKYLGELSVTFDDDGVIAEVSGDPIIIDGQVVEDEATLARVTELAEPLDEIRTQVVADSSAVIEGNRDVCRVQECEMGNLVADAMLARVAAQGVDIALMNSGGIRASIDAGEVTMGEVLTVLPFQNTLSTFSLTGADIVAALENGVSEVEEVAGRFPQVAGLQYVFDLSKPVGERIIEVLVAGDDGFAPIDPEATYGVVSNDYVRKGGDGYSVFAERASDVYDYGPSLDAVVADYLAASGSYVPSLDGRIAAR